MIRRRWWQESPVTRESAKETVKPSRGECRCCGLTCGDLRLVYFFTFVHGAMGAGSASGIPCALYLPRVADQQPGRFALRECGGVSGGVIARGESPEAIQCSPHLDRFVAFAPRDDGG